MFNNPFSMVVAIVLIVAIARVMRARYQAGHDLRPLTDDREAMELRDQVRSLKDRVTVLERLATDNHEANRIDQEIARLRDR